MVTALSKNHHIILNHKHLKYRGSRVSLFFGHASFPSFVSSLKYRMDCARSYKGVATCSGHGSCIMDLCVCLHPWTSQGDFELEIGYDCDINTTVIIAFAIISLFSSILEIAVATRNIYCMPSYTYRTITEPKSIVTICFLVSGIGGILYSIGKIMDPIFHVVGPNSGLAVCGYILFECAGFCGWAWFAQVIGEFLRQSAKIFSAQSQNDLRSNIDLVCKYISGISTLPMLLIIFPIAVVVKPEYGDDFVVGTLIWTGVLISIIGGPVVFVIHSFINEIGKYLVNTSDPPSDIVKVYKQMRILYVFCLSFVLLVLPTCILFASWSYLRRKSTYLLSLILFGKSPCEVLVLIFLTKRRKHASVQIQDQSAIQYVAVKNSETKNEKHLKATGTQTGESGNAMEEEPPNE